MLAWAALALPIVIFYILKVRQPQGSGFDDVVLAADLRGEAAALALGAAALTKLVQLSSMLLVLPLAEPFFRWESLRCRLVLVVDKLGGANATDVRRRGCGAKTEGHRVIDWLLPATRWRSPRRGPTVVLPAAHGTSAVAPLRSRRHCPERWADAGQGLLGRRLLADVHRKAFEAASAAGRRRGAVVERRGSTAAADPIGYELPLTPRRAGLESTVRRRRAGGRGRRHRGRSVTETARGGRSAGSTAAVQPAPSPPRAPRPAGDDGDRSVSVTPRCHGSPRGRHRSTTRTAAVLPILPGLGSSGISQTARHESPFADNVMIRARSSRSRARSTESDHDPALCALIGSAGRISQFSGHAIHAWRGSRKS